MKTRTNLANLSLCLLDLKRAEGCIVLLKRVLISAGETRFEDCAFRCDKEWYLYLHTGMQARVGSGDMGMPSTVCRFRIAE